MAQNPKIMCSDDLHFNLRPLAEMAPVVPKWAEFGQNQKIRKTELGKVTKFQKATPNGLVVIKKSP